jgi:hypothetical protein
MDDQRTDQEGGGVEPKRYVCLRHDSPGAAVVELFDHPHRIVPGIVAKSVGLDSIIFENGDQMTPRIWLDFDKDGRLISIEILDWGQNDENEEI